MTVENVATGQFEVLDSRPGAWMTPVSIGPKLTEELESILGRPFKSCEWELLIDCLEIANHIKECRPIKRGTVTMKIVRAQLESLSKMMPGRAFAFYLSVDEFTQAEIIRELHRVFGNQALDIRDPAFPERLPSAARHALTQLKKRRPPRGKPAKNFREVAACSAIKLWERFGETDRAVWVNVESGHRDSDKTVKHSRLVRWGKAFISAIDVSVSPKQVFRLFVKIRDK